MTKELRHVLFELIDDIEELSERVSDVYEREEKSAARSDGALDLLVAVPDDFLSAIGKLKRAIEY